MSHDAQFENDYKGYVGKFKPKIVSSEKTHTLTMIPLRDDLC